MSKNNTSLLLIITVLSFICNIIFVPLVITQGVELKILQQDTTKDHLIMVRKDQIINQQAQKLCDCFKYAK